MPPAGERRVEQQFHEVERKLGPVRVANPKNLHTVLKGRGHSLCRVRQRMRQEHFEQLFANRFSLFSPGFVLDPLALVELRATGSCTVALPEELFDMDGPGHYFRRIKSVAVTIPCVTGPFASVNCSLSLLQSYVRTKSTALGGAWYPTDPNDPDAASWADH